MTRGVSPENDAWLTLLMRHSPLLPEAQLRHHWQTLIPWLATADRYTLAAILLEIEHACSE
jgi:hypothetical protein